MKKFAITFSVAALLAVVFWVVKNPRHADVQPAEDTAPVSVSHVQSAKEDTEDPLIKELLEASVQGDPASMVKLGKIYLEGNAENFNNGLLLIKDASEKNADFIETANAVYKAASESSRLEDIYIKGLCLRYGIGVKQNTEEAIKVLETPAKQSFRPAAAALAEIYNEKFTSYREEIEKANLLKAESGETYLQANFIADAIARRDWKKTRDLIRKFEQKNIDRDELLACLAVAYKYGLGVRRDLQKSGSYMEKIKRPYVSHILNQMKLPQITIDQIMLEVRTLTAESEMNANQLVNLAISYSDSYLILPDKKKARRYLEAAELQRGDFYSSYNLEMAYRVYRDNIGDISKAMELIKHASSPSLQIEYARRLLLGSDVEKDPAKAVAILTDIAEEEKNSYRYEACEMLYWCHEYGIGVERNPRTAKKYYDIVNSAKPMELYHVGAAYLRKPDLFKQDKKRGFELLSKAAASKENRPMREYAYELAKENRHAEAVAIYLELLEQYPESEVFNLWTGILIMEGRGVKQNPELALKYLEKAKERGNRDAVEYLSYIYWCGKGVTQDKAKADEYMNEVLRDQDAYKTIKNAITAYDAGFIHPNDKDRCIYLLKILANLMNTPLNLEQKDFL